MFYVLLFVHLNIFIKRKTNLVHYLSSVYFVKHLYMFRAYLKPVIGRYVVWIQQLVLTVLFRWLSVISARIRDSHLKEQ